MATAPGAKNFLADIRILEIAGELGAYTGKLFADLGAEVIRIEPIAGDPVRFEKPFYKDIPGIENSLRYQYLNTNKKGIVLDLTTLEGQEVFLRLVRESDLLIESFPPGYLDSLNIGYKTCSTLNPKLVYTAITPYGQYGPYKDYPYSDITCMAMGGLLYLAGLGEDKPGLIPDKQSYFQGDLYAAYSSMASLMYADLTSEGQFIDVSLQECIGTSLEYAIQTYDLEGGIRRSSGGSQAGTGIYKCKDGYVFLYAVFAHRLATYWDPLVAWMKEEGVPDVEEKLKWENNWIEVTYRRSAEAMEIFREIFESWAAKYTMLELYEEGQKRKVIAYPANTAKGVLENPQLIYRQYFKNLHSEKLNGSIVIPGAPYFIENIACELKTAAPAFGEHTFEMLSQLGYSPDEINTFADKGVAVYAK